MKYHTEVGTSNRSASSAALAALGALAHEHRLAVYRLLVERGSDGLAAGDIAERIGLAPSSLTFHVQALLRAGLVTQRRSSRNLFYAADFDTMNALVAYLTENCCGGAACVPVCQPQSAMLQPRRRRGAVSR